MDGLGIRYYYVLKQIILFIYLTFIPGFLGIGILKLHNKFNVNEIIIYSIGLSNSILMLIGAIANYVYPLLGILKPISKLPLVITINILNTMLLIIYYINNKSFIKNIERSLKEAADKA